MEDESIKKAGVIKKETWIAGIIGALIGIGLVFLLQFLNVPGFGNEKLATFKGGKITKNSLYTEMKKSYPVSYILNIVDRQILDGKYTLDDKQQEEVKEQAEQYIAMYEMYYGITEEEFLEEQGLKSMDEFVELVALDYKRELYYEDYLKEKDADKKAEEYYNQNDVYGDITTKHILVDVTDESSKEEALKTAQEIIKKLNNGNSFDKVAEEYNNLISEEVSFNSLNADGFAQEYVDACKKLEVGKYTTEPVLTSFGYHVIYCIDKEEKPKLESVKTTILQKLGFTIDNALIELRDEYKFKIKDEKFKKQYEDYLNDIRQETY